MNWNLRYAIISYVRSTIWIAPVIALVLEQAKWRIAYAYQFDFGYVPGFVLGGAATIAAADYAITMMTAFIVFTFGSLLVAILASGQLTPRIITTTLLRDNVIRCTLGLFIYALLLAVAVKVRGETIPNFLESLMGILAIVGVVAFLFLIDYAARLLHPVSIVWSVAQQGLKVIEDVYPEATVDSQLPTRPHEKLGLKSTMKRFDVSWRG